MKHLYVFLLVSFIFLWNSQSIFALSQEHFETLKRANDKKWQANPYGCFQPLSYSDASLISAFSAGSTYEDVCKYNWMTEEEHIAEVKEFVPYVNSPSIFYDRIWSQIKSSIFTIKTTKNKSKQITVEAFIDKSIKNIKESIDLKGNKYIKSDVSDDTFRTFLLKKANELDPKIEAQKSKARLQAKKQKELLEKKKQDKLMKDAIAPFVQYINPQYKQYFYNSMQEHYIKELANVNDPAQTSFENLAEKQSAILTTANDFADYILINWTTEPSLVVKKWMEDTLRDAITEDVMKRYNI